MNDIKRLLLCGLALPLLLAACGDDGTKADTDTDTGGTTDTVGDTGADTVTPVDADEVFAFGIDPAQTISMAPFPYDLYLGSDGKVALASLSDDPIYKDLAASFALDAYDREMAKRSGFGSNTPVFFPMAAEPDLATFAGKVYILGVAGRDAGRQVKARFWWHAEAHALGVMADFGDYQVPGTTYAVYITAGVKTVDGTVISAPKYFGDVFADDPVGIDPEAAPARALWSDATAAWAALGIAESPVIGTVYTTEDVLGYGQKVLDAVAAAPLAAPTRRTGWDADAGAFITATPVEEADFAGYFGTPAAPFLTNPGSWGEGSRGSAADLEGAAYTGGSLHHGFGRIINGSIAAPSFNMKVDAGKAVAAPHRFDGAGKLVTDVTTLVPFTLWLCDAQLADPSNLPIAIATHGGTGHRSEMNSFANANCLNGVATIALDLPFHGGRTSMTWLADQGLQVSVQEDKLNAFTGLREGAQGYVADQIADNGGTADTAGGLFALPQSLDPEVAEANTMQISIDSLFLIRLLKDGDWSQVQAGLSFDAGHIYHESLSFGTSYSTMAMALSDDWRGIVSSVGSGRIISANLPIAPSNAFLAAGFLNAVLKLNLGIPRIEMAPWETPVLGFVQWLAERGDPLTWAPFVLRYRPTEKNMSVLSFGDSWDETLYGPAQVSYNNAFGFETFTSTGEWTIDGTMPAAGTVEGVAFPGTAAEPYSANVTYGAAVAHTAALFYWSKSCHTLVMAPVCTQRHEQPFPPIVELETPVTYASPVCAIHGVIRDFMATLQGSDAMGGVTPPTATCDAVYGAQ
ncbi:MAG: hypothetical protein H6745_22695 [Deltaproteobacteria bacterium]|nr:hypothetical protein [Deltaproteobacteria bacterium]